MIKSYISDVSLTGLAAEIEQDLEPLMIAAVDAGTDILLKEVKTTLDRVGKSAPGGPPSKDTGELLEAWHARKARKIKRAVTGQIWVQHPNKKKQGEIARKAAALEYGGTDQKGRVHPAFPYLRLAIAKTEDEIQSTMSRVLEEGA